MCAEHHVSVYSSLSAKPEQAAKCEDEKLWIAPLEQLAAFKRLLKKFCCSERLSIKKCELGGEAKQLDKGRPARPQPAPNPAQPRHIGQKHNHNVAKQGYRPPAEFDAAVEASSGKWIA